MRPARAAVPGSREAARRRIGPAEFVSIAVHLEEPSERTLPAARELSFRCRPAVRQENNYSNSITSMNSVVQFTMKCVTRVDGRAFVLEGNLS